MLGFDSVLSGYLPLVRDMVSDRQPSCSRVQIHPLYKLNMSIHRGLEVEPTICYHWYQEKEGPYFGFD